MGSRFLELYSWFQSPGFWIPRDNVSGFWITRAKVLRISEYRFPYMGNTMERGLGRKFRTKCILSPQAMIWFWNVRTNYISVNLLLKRKRNNLLTQSSFSCKLGALQFNVCLSVSIHVNFLNFGLSVVVIFTLVHNKLKSLTAVVILWCQQTIHLMELNP